ncbi:hypothetical protein LIER_07059 [Lithospermum erythrorhizon]|uniref:DUF674 domain-containing protein n=1 Tax=Lithospermum erythrorhizon TaxID=34254 RepID=A0AAV3P872_LITER
MSGSEVKLKLLVDTKSKKVMFAEAGKDCVDFLFYILSLPIGTVIRLLNKNGMVGCISNLYESIENLDQTYLQPNQNKDLILQPKLPFSSASVPLFSLTDGSSYQKSFYRCGCINRGNYVANDSRAVFPSCRRTMSTAVTYVAAEVVATEKSGQTEGGGVVIDVVTFMVMDNLEIKPMSTISSITLLNQFNVKEVGALQEKTVTLTMEKALKILELSLKSNTILTSVFLP